MNTMKVNYLSRRGLHLGRIPFIVGLYFGAMLFSFLILVFPGLVMILTAIALACLSVAILGVLLRWTSFVYFRTIASLEISLRSTPGTKGYQDIMHLESCLSMPSGSAGIDELEQ